MTLRRLSYLLAAAATMALAACSADGGDTPGGDTPQEGAAVSVPLTVSFSGEWSTDDEGGGTRVAPPEQGDTNGDGAITDADLIGGREELEPVNRVRIITFRRKDADVTGQPSGSFEYDPTNDITATCKWNADKTLKTAKATLTKLYSYEYRVVAIAYDAVVSPVSRPCPVPVPVPVPFLSPLRSVPILSPPSSPPSSPSPSPLLAGRRFVAFFRSEG